MKKGLILFFSLVIFFGLRAVPVRAAANVTFDSQGTWIINGQRWFLYSTNRIPRLQGHHHLEDSDWQRAVDYYHINMIVSGTLNTYTKANQFNNFYLISGLPNIKDPDTWDSAEDKQRIRDEANQPRMLFFYACDECGNQTAGYEWLSANYPNIPAHINVMGIESKYFRSDFKAHLNHIKAAIISSHVGDASVKTHAMVSLRDDPETTYLKSAYMLFRKNENPHLEEDIFKSIVGGINGIKFWEPEQPWIATSDTFSGNNWGEVIARVGGYLAEIQPGLVAPNRQYKTGYMLSKGEDNRWYVVATPATNSLTVTGLPANTEFEKLFYSPGTVTTNAQGTLTDNSAGKIKIYRQKTVPSPSPASKPGDFNNDGKVNWHDYQVFRSGFGDTYNIFHYNQLVRNYNK